MQMMYEIIYKALKEVGLDDKLDMLLEAYFVQIDDTLSKLAITCNRPLLSHLLIITNTVVFTHYTLPPSV
jgi:hypothetical protein